MASTNAILLRENIGPIAVLTLNRPQARNSLSEDLLAALSDALTAIAADDSVRAVVIAADGRGFRAGHDMRELLAHRTGADGGRAYFEKLMDQCSSVMQAIVHLPQPVIAAVPGPPPPLVVRSSRAAISRSPRLRPGSAHLASTSVSSVPHRWWRSRATSRPRARDGDAAHWRHDLGRTGATHGSRQPRGDTRPGTRRSHPPRRAGFAAKSAAVVKIGKQAFYNQIAMNLADAYRHASAVMVENMMLHDAAESARSREAQADLGRSIRSRASGGLRQHLGHPVHTLPQPRYRKIDERAQLRRRMRTAWIERVRRPGST